MAIFAMTNASSPDWSRLIEAAFKEGVATGYEFGKAGEGTTDAWHEAWLDSNASYDAGRARDQRFSANFKAALEDVVRKLRPMTEEEAREMIQFAPDALIRCLRQWGCIEERGENTPAQPDGST